MITNVLCVDSHPAARIGLSVDLGQNEFQVFSAENLETADRILNKHSIEVVVLDVMFPDGDAFHWMENFNRLFPKIKLIVFSAVENPLFINRASELKTAAYLSKTTPIPNLVAAIRKVADGETLWSKDQLRRVAGSMATERLSIEIEAPLTKRENDVLQQLTKGLTNKEIANSLQISYETVKEHVQHILRKTGLGDRTQAAVWAVRNGLA